MSSLSCHLISHRPLPACSLGDNHLTNEFSNHGPKDMSGLLKLVEILPLTKIKSLECAAASKCFAFVSAPIDTPTLSPFPSCPFLDCSIGGKRIGDEGASALAAVLEETKISEL